MSIIQDISNINALTEPQINFDSLDNITLNQKLDSIFNNIINNTEDIKLIPKINDSKKLVIFFEFFFNRLNEIVTMPNILEKCNVIFKYLSETLINNFIILLEKKEQEKISHFFYNLNFFEILITSLNNQDISLFKENFVLFLQVSFFYLISFLDFPKCFK